MLTSASLATLGTVMVMGAGACSTRPQPSTSICDNVDSSHRELTSIITAGISDDVDPGSFDPLTATGPLELSVNWHTMEGLTELHPGTRRCFATLASDMPVKIDETTYRVTLRNGAQFADGRVVSADDVLFSFERVLNPYSGSPVRPFVSFIDTLTAVDERTIEFHLNYPFPLIDLRLSVVKIVAKGEHGVPVQGCGQWPLGSGPYVMVDDGTTSQEIRFVRNEHYNGPFPPRSDRMVWRILPDSITRVNALTSGAVQAIDALPVEDISVITQPNIVSAQQGFGMLFTLFNCGSTPMNQVKNRQALMYSLDYQSICGHGMGGYAAPASCFVEEGHPAYMPASTIYRRDVDKARALFDETGLKSIRVLCASFDWLSQVYAIIQGNLKEVGLTISYEEKKLADVYSTITGNPDAFDVVIAPGDPSVFGDDCDLLLRWWYANPLWTQERMHWSMSESYASLQQYLEEAVRQTGQNQRDTWKKIFDLLSEQVPLYPIFHRQTVTAYNPNTLVDFSPISVPGLYFLGAGSTEK
ncbi:ABC transporter substrate-binding protein [Actinomyces vulturis]|uniref:ABC transporter substrate-binding protein n=1 Tax=Actinomyces vulturis TaxID=1857645 RepID=UPI00159EDCBB|nr:ABC transporter substrate-binding protein [Actinomyces vulturis]